MTICFKEPSFGKSSWYVYVLELEDGCYYVGITIDLDRRFRQHCLSDISSSYFTRQHRPIRIVEHYCCHTTSQKEAVKLESETTVKYALVYGVDKVRGGKYMDYKGVGKLMRRVKAERSKK